jgi:hypothetical protein
MSQMPTLRSVYRLKAALDDRLERILKRATIVKNELASRRLMEGSEEHRELVHEQLDLRGAEMATRNALAEISKRDTEVEANCHERTVQIFLAESEKVFARSQAQWQKIGDHRNGRLYRMQFLDVRMKIEQELGLPGIPR